MSTAQEVRAAWGFLSPCGPIWLPEQSGAPTGDRCGLPMVGVRFEPREDRRRKRRRRRREPLRRAREWERLLAEGRFSSRAELARAMGVSRAAVTQALRRLSALTGGP
jgi:hypothetical protein